MDFYTSFWRMCLILVAMFMDRISSKQTQSVLSFTVPRESTASFAYMNTTTHISSCKIFVRVAGSTIPPHNTHYNRRIVNPILKSDRFEEVMTSKQFVDKTLFIPWFLQGPNSFYVTSPPKTGKTTLLTMTRLYLQLQLHPNGTQITPNTTKQHAMFKTPNRFDGTNHSLFLCDCPNFSFYDHFQQYFVVYLDFTPLTAITDFSSFETKLCEIVEGVFSEFHKLPIPNPDDNPDCELIQTLIKGYADKKFPKKLIRDHQLNLEQLITGFHGCYDKKTVLLIDKYDAILHAVMMHDITQADVEKIILALREFMSTVSANNPHVNQTLCVGVLSFGSSRLIATNITDVDFFSAHALAIFIGIMDFEINSLLSMYSMMPLMNQLASYYDGYKVVNKDIKKVYNLGSILSYIEENRTTEYFTTEARWYEMFDSLFSDPEFGRQVLQTNVEKDSVILEMDDGRLLFEQILTLKRKIQNVDPSTGALYMDKSLIDAVFQYFLELGYYKIENEIGEGKEPHINLITGTNLETRNSLAKMVYLSDFTQNYYRITPGNIAAFGDALNGLNITDKRSFVPLMEAMSHLCHTPLQKETLRHFQFPVYSSAMRLKLQGVLRAAETDLTLKNGNLLFVNSNRIGIVMKLETEQPSINGLYQMLSDRHFLGYDREVLKSFNIFKAVLINIRCNKKKECDLCYLYDKGKSSFSTECLVYPTKKISR